MKETDLFPAVRDYLQGEGYDTYAEVKSCDVVGARGDELVIVELKLSLNLTLVRQAVARQKLCRDVYIAIPEPKRINRPFRETEEILRRLGLGLLTIYFSPLRSSAAALRFRPDFDGKLETRKLAAVRKEIDGRSANLNQGGSTGTTIYTAYRETAFSIAWMISEHGPMRVKDIRPACGEKTQSILAKNHYGWFERVARGTYDLTTDGQTALGEHPELRALAETRLGNTPHLP